MHAPAARRPERRALICVAALCWSCGGGAAGPAPLGPPAMTTGRAVAAETEALASVHRSAIFALTTARLDAAEADVLAALVPAAAPRLAALRALVPHGVAPDQRAGVVVLDLGAGTTAWFAGIADEMRLRAHLERRKDVRETTAGTSRIFAGEASSIVVRDRHVFVVRSGARSQRDLAAVRIATLAPEDSLARRASFRAAVDRLGFGTTLSGYLSMGALGRDRLRAAEAWEFELGNIVAELQGRVRDARRRGVSAEERARLQAELQHQERWLESARRVAAADKALAMELIGALGGVAFGLELDDGAFRVKAVAEPLAGSLAADALAPGRTADPQLVLEPPLRAALVAQVSRARLMALVELGAALMGADPAAARARVLREGDALTGEMGVELDGSGALAAWLGRAGDGSPAAVTTEAIAQPGFEESRLVTLRDRLLLGRAAVVERATPRPHAALAALAGRGAPALLVLLGPAALADALAPPAREVAAMSAPPRDHNDDVPFSERYLALEAELAGLGERITAARARLAGAERQTDGAALRSLASLALAVERSERWLVAYGELTLPSGTADEVATKLAEVIEAADAEVDAARDAVKVLEAEYAAGHQRLLELRVEDIQRSQ